MQLVNMRLNSEDKINVSGLLGLIERELVGNNLITKTRAV